MKITTKLLKKLNGDSCMITRFYNTKKLHDIDFTNLTEIRVTDEQLFYDLFWLQSQIKNKLKKLTYTCLEYDNDVYGDEMYGYTETYIFNDKGNRIISKYNEHKTKYSYDDNGRLLTTIDNDGFKTENIYNDNGILIGIKYSNGYVDEFSYDENGNNIFFKSYDSEINDGKFSYEKYAYDEKNNRISTEDSDGNIYEYTYDDKGNTSTIKNYFSINKETYYTKFTYNKYGIITHFTEDDITKKFNQKYDLTGFKYK